MKKTDITHDPIDGLSKMPRQQKKKKYLGSTIGAFGAVYCPCMIVGAIVFAITALRVEISVASVLLAVMCLSCSIIWAYFAWKNRYQFYSWGTFRCDTVDVSVFLRKEFSLSYADCKGCWIGYYRHAFMNNPNSILGSNVYFIYLSLSPFSEKYRDQINKWVPTKTRIKAPFSKALYGYLIKNLPSRQASMLQRDYKKYFA